MNESISRLQIKVGTEGSDYKLDENRVVYTKNNTDYYVSSIGQKYNKIFEDTKAKVIKAKKEYTESRRLGTVDEDADYE